MSCTFSLNLGYYFLIYFIQWYFQLWFVFYYLKVEVSMLKEYSYWLSCSEKYVIKHRDIWGPTEVIGKCLIYQISSIVFQKTYSASKNLLRLSGAIIDIIIRKWIGFRIHRHAEKGMLEFGFACYFLRRAVEDQFTFLGGKLHKVPV